MTSYPEGVSISGAFSWFSYKHIEVRILIYGVNMAKRKPRPKRLLSWHFVQLSLRFKIKFQKCINCNRKLLVFTLFRKQNEIAIILTGIPKKHMHVFWHSSAVGTLILNSSGVEVTISIQKLPYYLATKYATEFKMNFNKYPPHWYLLQ